MRKDFDEWPRREGREAGVIDSQIQTGRRQSARPGRGNVTPFGGQGLAQSFGAWRRPGPLPCGRPRLGRGVWVQRQAGLMKTRLGLASEKIIMDFWKLY